MFDLHRLRSLSESKVKIEKAIDASARYEKFKKMLDANVPGVTLQQVQGIKKIADSLWDTEMRAREKNLIDTHGAEWWELVKKQYPIIERDGKFIVTSEIRKWVGGKDWEFDYKGQALEKIEQLVQWLHSGRSRGYGSKDADIQKWLKALDDIDKK